MNILYYIFLSFFLFLSFYIYFHRSPNIICNNIPNNYIYSPAYGKIIAIKEKDNYIHIIIFLSPLDIHIQYMPINGSILNQIYDNTGKFHLAFNINKSNKNEKLLSIIQPILNIQPIFVQQIAGTFTRRIKSYISSFPKKLNTCDKLGIILLGSRVDLILPKDNLILYVKENDKVYGPNTPIGKYLKKID
jgi:phosphatidylserine decarboxylase